MTLETHQNPTSNNLYGVSSILCLEHVQFDGYSNSPTPHPTSKTLFNLVNGAKDK